jgi:hypothetical protein
MSLHLFIEIVASVLRPESEAEHCIEMQAQIDSLNPAFNVSQLSRRAIQRGKPEAPHYNQINTKN